MHAPESQETAKRPVDASRPRGVPLYVHFPFCVVKCTYCDFYSVEEFRGSSTKSQDLSFVLDDLLREAERRASTSPVTVFLGGGTPSIHEPDDLARFLDGLDDVTGFRASAVEVTMECNPESLDLETAQAALEGGVNRLSIGIQSLDSEVLQLFGRAHGPDDGIKAFTAARAAGCTNLNVDVIYGSPGQNLAAMLAEIETISAWGPDHVSAYSLAYEQGTLMTHWRAKGVVQDLPEEAARELFERARAGWTERGMAPYEISNYTAKNPCLHNLNAWWNGPYVGIGPSAVSFVDSVRFGQSRSVGAWKRALETDGSRVPMDWEEHLTSEQRRGESWWLGLRVSQGVDPRFLRDAHWDPEQFLKRARHETSLHRGEPVGEIPGALELEGPDIELAKSLAHEGWLVREGERWRVAEHAWPIVDALARKFLLLSGD